MPGLPLPLQHSSLCKLYPCSIYLITGVNIYIGSTYKLSFNMLSISWGYILKQCLRIPHERIEQNNPSWLFLHTIIDRFTIINFIILTYINIMSIKNSEGNIDICVLAVYDSERIMGDIDGNIDGVFGYRKRKGLRGWTLMHEVWVLISGIKSRAYLEVWHWNLAWERSIEMRNEVSYWNRRSRIFW